MNPPSIPPGIVPALPKKKHGRLFYSCLACIGVVVFLLLAAVVMWMMAVICFYEIGLDKRREGDWDGAIGSLTLAIRLCPIDADAYYERAIAYNDKGDSDKVIADCTRAIELEPQYARAYRCRGLAYNDKGDYDKAIADLDNAIELSGKDDLAYYYRGLAHISKGDYDKAIADCTRAIELDPEHSAVYCCRGLAHINKGDYGKAIADCNRAIELDPKDGCASYFRACVYYMQRRWSDALADFRRSCEGGDSKLQSHAHLGLWGVRSQLGQKEAANKELAAYFDKRSNTTDPWLARIADFLLGRTGENDLMVAASPDARKEQGRRPNGWYYAGMKRLLAGDKTGAVDCFRKCLAMSRKYDMECYLARSELKALGL